MVNPPAKQKRIREEYAQKRNNVAKFGNTK
jgi:hypothetical protein